MLAMYLDHSRARETGDSGKCWRICVLTARGAAFVRPFRAWHPSTKIPHPSFLQLWCAVENQGGQDVEELKIKLYRTKTGSEIGQKRAVVLKDEQRTLCLQSLARLGHDLFSQSFWQQAVRQARDNVIGGRESLFCQNAANMGG